MTENYSAPNKKHATQRPKKPKKQMSPVTGFVAGAAITAAIAGGIHVIPSLTAPAHVEQGQTTLSEDQLDYALGTWTYKGKTHTVTVREAMDTSGAASAYKTDDGDYAMPSASAVLTIAKESVIAQLAEDNGITVTDDDIKAAAKAQYGTEDLTSIASAYSTSKEAIKTIIKNNLLQDKYREKVVGEEPVAPDAPAEDLSDSEYADYIKNLAGKAWTDSGWKDNDSDWAVTLGDFDGSSATYDQANAAYNIGLNEWYSNNGDRKWADTINPELAEVTVVTYNAML